MNNATVHLKLVVVAAIWGLGWPAGRVVASNVEPISGAWLRYILVVLMFLAYLKTTDRWITPSPSQWKVIFAIGFFSTDFSNAVCSGFNFLEFGRVIGMRFG